MAKKPDQPTTKQPPVAMSRIDAATRHQGTQGTHDADRVESSRWHPLRERRWQEPPSSPYGVRGRRSRQPRGSVWSL